MGGTTGAGPDGTGRTGFQRREDIDPIAKKLDSLGNHIKTISQNERFVDYRISGKFGKARIVGKLESSNPEEKTWTIYVKSRRACGLPTGENLKLTSRTFQEGYDLIYNHAEYLAEVLNGLR